MDLTARRYDKEIYDDYILGSAEVVGLMCLKVFTENNEKKYNHLRDYAMKLQALSCNVPILGLTSDFEQEWNMNRIEQLGFGLQWIMLLLLRS